MEKKTTTYKYTTFILHSQLQSERSCDHQSRGDWCTAGTMAIQLNINESPKSPRNDSFDAFIYAFAVDSRAFSSLFCPSANVLR